MKCLWLAPALVLAACGAGPAPLVGYLRSDVLEPEQMANPRADNVRIQPPLFQEGTLTYEGDGEVDLVFMSYIDRMQLMRWNVSSTEQRPSERMVARLAKDDRILLLEVTPGEQEDVRVVIQVTRRTE